MLLPDSVSKLPLAEMKKRGFELKPEDIYSLTKPSLKDAIVQISVGHGVVRFARGPDTDQSPYGIRSRHARDAERLHQ